MDLLAKPSIAVSTVISALEEAPVCSAPPAQPEIALFVSALPSFQAVSAVPIVQTTVNTPPVASAITVT